MGKIEQKVKKRAKKENLRTLILYSFALAGVAGVAVLAPNALQVLGKFGILDTKNKNLNRSLRSLIKKGLVEFKAGAHGKKFLSLTSKGKTKLMLWELSNFKIQKPRRWDGKWRIMIFDIKEKRRRTRDQLRTILTRIGCVRLQHSVWVYPYECEELMTLLKADMELGRNLLYVVADEIENDKYLREHFGLASDTF